jgi:GNAT superfamily N-acetyltransferase
MIIAIDQTNVLQAAEVHSVSWQESHRSFCSPEFVNLHTPEHQKDYLTEKMNAGSKIYMLVEDKPIGIVSVTGSLIEDLYVLPEKQGMGYGTALLQFAIGKCTGVPTLWILENNKKAEKLYRRIGFRETGRRSEITEKIYEIEFSLY